MKSAILIQQIYPDTPGVPMLELTRDRHARYCQEHDFDFKSVVAEVVPELAKTPGSWAKVHLIHGALEDGYRRVVWLDADTLIYNTDTDLRLGCPDGIGACYHRIPQLNHWNVGALYMQNSTRVRRFIDDWLASFPGERSWMEQGEFNRLAMQSDVVQTISDRWNSTVNHTMVPDAVVLGFHGDGNTQERLKHMQGVLDKISEKKAVREPGIKAEAHSIG